MHCLEPLDLLQIFILFAFLGVFEYLSFLTSSLEFFITECFVGVGV